MVQRGFQLLRFTSVAQQVAKLKTSCCTSLRQFQPMRFEDQVFIPKGTSSASLDKMLKVSDLEIKHHFAGGVYAKQTTIAAGLVLTQHKHNYDHLSILASGVVMLSVDDVNTRIVAPACITIPANTNHCVSTLEDSVWFCIHATEVTDIESVDKTLISENP